MPSSKHFKLIYWMRIVFRLKVRTIFTNYLIAARSELVSMLNLLLDAHRKTLFRFNELRKIEDLSRGFYLTIFIFVDFFLNIIVIKTCSINCVFIAWDFILFSLSISKNLPRSAHLIVVSSRLSHFPDSIQFNALSSYISNDILDRNQPRRLLFPFCFMRKVSRFSFSFFSAF